LSRQVKKEQNPSKGKTPSHVSRPDVSGLAGRITTGGGRWNRVPKNWVLEKRDTPEKKKNTRPAKACPGQEQKRK